MTKPTVEELLNDIAVVAIEHGHESHVERVLVALRERLVGEQQTREEADIGRLVKAKFVSGNSIPVERIVIRADELRALKPTTEAGGGET
jgi:hypothetical protein